MFCSDVTLPLENVLWMETQKCLNMCRPHSTVVLLTHLLLLHLQELDEMSPQGFLLLQFVQPVATQLRTICLLWLVRRWKIWKYCNSNHAVLLKKKNGLAQVTKKTDSIKYGSISTLWCHMQNLDTLKPDGAWECRRIAIRILEMFEVALKHRYIRGKCKNTTLSFWKNSMTLRNTSTLNMQKSLLWKVYIMSRITRNILQRLESKSYSPNSHPQSLFHCWDT